MRKKALLVAASSPFVGPRVTLEKGSWVIDKPKESERVNLQVVATDEEDQLSFLGDKLVVQGPLVIWVELEEGRNVNLSARQISNA